MRERQPGTGDAQYRRGAVMGLTVAEAFMLVAFVLLMLLALWRAEQETEVAKLAPLTMTTAQQIAAGLSAPEVPSLLALAARPGDLRDVLAREEAAGSNDGSLASVSKARLGELEDRARLVDEADIRRLAEVAAQLGPEPRKLLASLVAVDDFAAAIETLAEVKAVVGDRSIADLAAALALAEAVSALPVDDQRSLRDFISGSPTSQRINRLLDLERITAGESVGAVAAAIRMASLTPPGAPDASDIRRRILDRVAASEEARQSIVSEVDAELGGTIRRAGGRIDENGAIVLPDELLFEAGSAALRPTLTTFLREFCEPWLTTVRQAGLDVDEIRIEGHASSEWNGATDASDAFLRNLDLSQRRAQAVLDRCLREADDPLIKGWARQHLTAVGYSSSRPVETDGVVDPKRSRRVVFDLSLDRDQAIAGIESELGDTQTTVFSGPAAVIDGDTIEINGRNIRIAGVDGPELAQPCDRDGVAWSCGRDSATALTTWLGGRTVECRSTGSDRYGRPLATCTVEGIDVGGWLVAQGWAWAYREYADTYVQAEETAKAEARNVWSGNAVAPWDFRRARRSATARASSTL